MITSSQTHNRIILHVQLIRPSSKKYIKSTQHYRTLQLTTAIILNKWIRAEIDNNITHIVFKSEFIGEIFYSAWTKISVRIHYFTSDRIILLSTKARAKIYNNNTHSSLVFLMYWRKL